MEVIIGILLLCLALYLLYLLIVYVILPLGGILIVIASVIGVLVGGFFALKSYICALRDNFDPYALWVDNSKHREEFATRRSYFFGPGYVQMWHIFIDTMFNMGDAFSWVNRVRRSIASWLDIMVLKQILWVASMIFAIISWITIGVLGSLIALGLTLAQAVVTFSIMVLVYIIFSVVWLIDRIYLHLHSISARCPVCDCASVVPMFECSGCHNLHERLVPGPYGIFRRTCKCGEKLPTTFLLGRSRLTARCPHCGNEMAASGTSHFSIAVVGGSMSGKTVLLTAFYQSFFETVNKHPSVYYEIPEIHKGMFQHMDAWYRGLHAESTTVTGSADMYSVILNSDALKIPKQFSLYDMPGEAFNDPEMTEMYTMHHLRYSDGLMFVIDPLSSDRMRANALNEGDSTDGFSDVDAGGVISNFVTYLHTKLLHDKISKRSNKPVAVVITKTDLPSVKRQLSYITIKNAFKQDPNRFGNKIQNARDMMCRDFLSSIGLGNAVNTIEASFTNVHYYPVTAIGHQDNGMQYDPEHVEEPFYYLLHATQPDLAKLLDLPNPEAAE